MLSSVVTLTRSAHDPRGDPQSRPYREPAIEVKSANHTYLAEPTRFAHQAIRSPHQQDDYRETPKSPGAFLAHGNAPRRSSRTLGQRNPGFRASHRHPGRFGAEHPATGPQWAKLPDAGKRPGTHAFLITIRGVRTFRAQPLHRDDTYLRRKTMVRLDTRQTGFNLQGRRPPLFYAFHRVIHCENQESMIR